MSRDTSTKLLAGFVIFGIVALILLALWWVVWSLWCYVLGAVWPGGPAAIVAPGYWLFVAAWLLLGFIGRLLFYHPDGTTSKE